mmetsp:Transcript_96943/g.274526  ORF Transcript_96943/g.274526 Transcript_96943/m.274526 type:complete len:209 (-) Transcript_96943:192-818(-)
MLVPTVAATAMTILLGAMVLATHQRTHPWLASYSPLPAQLHWPCTGPLMPTGTAATANVTPVPGSAARRGGLQVGGSAHTPRRLRPPCSWWWSALKSTTSSCALSRRLRAGLLTCERPGAVPRLQAAWLTAAPAPAASPGTPGGFARGPARCCWAAASLLRRRSRSSPSWRATVCERQCTCRGSSAAAAGQIPQTGEGPPIDSPRSWN